MKNRRIPLLAGALALLCLLACACGSAAQQPQEPEANAELTALLEKVDTDYHPGTAGCSLVGAGLAGRLLDWYAGSDAGEDTVRATAKAYYDGLDSERQETFGELLVSVSELSYELIGENAASLLETAGYEATAFPWSAEAQQTLFGALCEGCGRQMPAAPETNAPAA